jgi:hypothetical protein
VTAVRPACTRRAFLAGLGASAVLAWGPQTRADAEIAGDDDDAILNIALALEHLQAAFYSEAKRLGALGPIGSRAAAALGGVERAHVAALTDALADRAAAPPRFDFGGATSDDEAFVRTAVAIEELAAATHLAQLSGLASAEHRGLLASIRTVDAGHASWIRLLAGARPVTHALDEPLGADDAVAMLIGSGIASPRVGAGPDDPWSTAPPAGADLLAAFPLVHPIGAAHRSGDSPATARIAAATAVSALVLGGLGLRARRHAHRRIVVVGPDEGPSVLQQAVAPGDGGEHGGVAGRRAETQTARVPVLRPQKEKV